LLKVWVDTYGDEGDVVLNVFKPYLEAENIPKVCLSDTFPAFLGHLVG
jgi:hypothetical protein